MLSIPNHQKEQLKSVEEIVETICKMFNVNRHDLYSNKRHEHIVDARFVIYHILHFHPFYRMRVIQLARLFDRDHTGVLHLLNDFDINPKKRERVLYKLQSAHMEIFGHLGFMQPYSPKMVNTGKNNFAIP